MSNLKLAHWFFIWFGAMVLLVVLTQPAQRPDKMDKEGYNTTRSSVMYFKNIRSFYYLKTEEAGGILVAYRLKSLYESPDGAWIPFVIYQNEHSREAFIRVDTGFVSPGHSFLKMDSDSLQMVLPFPGPDQASQYAFGKLVFEVLRSEGRLFLHSESGEDAEITGQKKIQIRITLTDYFKLTDKL